MQSEKDDASVDAAAASKESNIGKRIAGRREAKVGQSSPRYRVVKVLRPRAGTDEMEESWAIEDTKPPANLLGTIYPSEAACSEECRRLNQGAYSP